MITIEEYRRKEQEFTERHDSLCESTPPEQCDCSKCPTSELCKWLCDNWVQVINDLTLPKIYR